MELLLDWEPLPRLEARLAYTYQRFTFTRFIAPEGDFSGKRESHRRRRISSPSGPAIELPFGLRGSAQLQRVSAYPVNNANTLSNWAYTVVDLRVAASHAWRMLGARPYFGIDNLFDERYNGSTVPNAAGARFFEPSPGRQGYVGLTLELGGS